MIRFRILRWWGLLVPLLGSGQTPVPTAVWTLEQARQQALSQSTLGQQATAAGMVAQRRLAAARSQQLPQLGLNGQASWQNTAVEFPGVVSVPREQFRTELELTQLLYDAGRLRSDRAVTTAQQALDTARIAEQREQVVRRTDRLFFEVLLADAQVRARERGLSRLEAQQTLVAAQVREGVALPANLNELTAAVLRQRQDVVEARARHQAVVQQLAQWLDVTPDALGRLALPDRTPAAALPPELGLRPELATLDAQQALLARQQTRILADRGPRVELFGTGGYGQPNPLNFTIVDPDFYFLGGIRLRWTLWNNQRNRYEAEALAAQQAQVAAQQAERRRNLALELAQPLALVQAYDTLLLTDDEIIGRQQQVAESTRRRLQEGTATVSDYVSDLSDLLLAEINQELHRILRLQAETELRLLVGQSTPPDSRFP